MWSEDVLILKEDFSVCCNGVFCRGLYVVLRLSRVIFWNSGNVITPYTEGIYVFYGVKGVVKMVIFGVNDWSFLPALDTFGKNRRPRRRGLTAGQYLMQNSLHKIKIHISSAQLKREWNPQNQIKAICSPQNNKVNKRKVLFSFSYLA